MASNITGTTPGSFRKRLELSRKLIGGFLGTYCGVYNPYNNCRCNKRINSALSCGTIRKNNLNFANKIELYNNEMEELNSLSGVYQNHGTFKSNLDFISKLNKIISTKGIINDN